MSVYIETGFAGDEYPMTHPRIGYIRRGTREAVTATTSASGFDAVNAFFPRTDSAWRPTALPARWAVIFPGDRILSYIGIAKHDLGTQGASITVQYTTNGGSTWTAIAGLSALLPADDSAIMLLFTPVVANGYRLIINSGADVPTIAVIRGGEVMEWPQPCTWVGEPITEGDQISFSVNRTDTGNWVGRTKVSDGLQFSVEFDNLSEDYRNGAFADFKAYANGEDATFWIAKRPGTEPEEVAYAWALDTVKASRSRPNKRNAGSVSLNLQGLRPNG